MGKTLVTVFSSGWFKLLLRGQSSLLPRLYIFLQMMREKASKHIMFLNDRLHGWVLVFIFFCLFVLCKRWVLKAPALSASWHDDCLF